MTLKQLEEEVLKKSLNLIEPEVTVSETSTVILTSEDEFSKEYLDRTLTVSFFYIFIYIINCMIYQYIKKFYL